jgi:NAD(P)-dependent dehydrogenase (short-subunit alcohol dehydrogenase family)
MIWGTGSSALVTGAARGLGRAFAAALAARGTRLTIADIDPEIVQVAEELTADSGDHVRAVIADVSRPDDARHLIAEAVHHGGGLDVLVNNAGVNLPTAPTDDIEQTVRDFNHIMGVNLQGPLLLGRLAAPVMILRRRGHIVNVSTDHVHNCGWPVPVDHDDAASCPWATEPRGPGGRTHMDIYDASKWALNGLTQAWALALRPHGVRVNNLCMGATDSPMLRAFHGPATNEQAAQWMKPDSVATVLLALLDESPGRSADNVGVWMGHPTVLPAPGPFAYFVG